MHMKKTPGKEWPPSSHEYYEYGMALLLVFEYAASSSHKESSWHKLQVPKQIRGYDQPVTTISTYANTEKRADGPEVSLSIIPANHVTLKTHNLEAEASGLLDRMLAVFHENSRYVCFSTSVYYATNPCSDAVSIDATLNSLSILIRTRPQTSNKILNAILNFNPLKQANSPMTPKSRVVIKSMEKTTRMLLIHLIKRYAIPSS